MQQKKEINNFLNKIENELSQKWNIQKKKFEDIKFVPKRGQKYYYIGLKYNKLSVILSVFDHNHSDHFRFANDNCFKNKAIADKKLNEIINDIKNGRD